jgi:dienelactone hydrolase
MKQRFSTLFSKPKNRGSAVIKAFYVHKFSNIFGLVAVVLLAYGSVFAAAQEKRVVIENDGWRLVGDLLVPKAKKAVPAVILLNKANGDRKVYENLARYLAENGIASLRVDLRGHGESINKGKFVPFQENAADVLNNTDKDIFAVTEYLKATKGIDANRIGFVGASYSGEEMAVAARKNGYAKAYVALSPGSFSEESVKALDPSGATWLFIKSADERAQTLKDFFSAVRLKSKRAQTWEVAGNKHATDILETNAELAEMLAVWFKYRLQ